MNLNSFSWDSGPFSFSFFFFFFLRIICLYILRASSTVYGNQLNVKILSVCWFVIQLHVASHHDVLGFDFNFFFFLRKFQT